MFTPMVRIGSSDSKTNHITCSEMHLGDVHSAIADIRFTYREDVVDGGHNSFSMHFTGVAADKPAPYLFGNFGGFWFSAFWPLPMMLAMVLDRLPAPDAAQVFEWPRVASLVEAIRRMTEDVTAAVKGSGYLHFTPDGQPTEYLEDSYVYLNGWQGPKGHVTYLLVYNDDKLHVRESLYLCNFNPQQAAYMLTAMFDRTAAVKDLADLTLPEMNAE